MRKKDGKFSGIIYIHRLAKKKKKKKLGTPVKCINTNFCLNNRTLPRDHEFYNYGYIYCNAHAKYLLSLPTKCTEKGRFFND